MNVAPNRARRQDAHVIYQSFKIPRIGWMQSIIKFNNEHEQYKLPRETRVALGLLLINSKPEGLGPANDSYRHKRIIFSSTSCRRVSRYRMRRQAHTKLRDARILWVEEQVRGTRTGNKAGLQKLYLLWAEHCIGRSGTPQVNKPLNQLIWGPAAGRFATQEQHDPDRHYQTQNPREACRLHLSECGQTQPRRP